MSAPFTASLLREEAHLALQGRDSITQAAVKENPETSVAQRSEMQVSARPARAAVVGSLVHVGSQAPRLVRLCHLHVWLPSPGHGSYQQSWEEPLAHPRWPERVPPSLLTLGGWEVWLCQGLGIPLGVWGAGFGLHASKAGGPTVLAASCLSPLPLMSSLGHVIVRRESWGWGETCLLDLCRGTMRSLLPHYGEGPRAASQRLLLVGSGAVLSFDTLPSCLSSEVGKMSRPRSGIKCEVGMLG